MASKERTSWNNEDIEIFLDLIKENKKSRGGKYNWDTIILRLNAETGKEFEKKQLENFYSDIRGKFKAWNELKSWIGIGWNEETGCPVIDPKDEKWKAFIKKHKNSSSFLKKPLIFEDKLYDIFVGTYATSNKSWSPAVGGPTIQTKHKQPMILVQDDFKEGVGDSEEELRTKDDDMEDTERSAYESRSPLKSISSSKRKSSDCGATSRKSVKDDIETCMDYLRRNMQLGSSKTQPRPSPSKYEKMISILEGMLAVSNYGKSFILQVLEFLRDPDESDLFLSLPDNEFRILYFEDKNLIPK
ncbi:uncharacterized protein LOC110691596 [Chenopodium quinoa]|uniref:uncharacterized protein LOC110691596 n=1 Tax=Chenopodium quinoa TaxID=63459 RepID=UPI000B785EFB|nr:uncharacterized protein LOC110691596 [Chenopodium quinoa]